MLMALHDRQARRVWWALAVASVALGVIRQFQVLAVVTELGRVSARSEGWYADRRVLQGALLAGFVCVWLLLLVPLSRRARRFPRAPVVAATMIGLLAALAGLQLVSLHQVDSILNYVIAGIRVARWLELAALLMLCGTTIAARLGWGADSAYSAQRQSTF